MTAPDPIVGPSRWIQRVGTFAAIVLVWLFVVGIGTTCFFPLGPSFPPGASEDWADFDNALVFGASLAIANAFASVTAFTVGGKVRWAVGVASAIVLATAVFVAVACVCLWLAPGIARGQMGYWEFERLRATTVRWVAAIVRNMIPLGAGVGSLLGVLAGLLAVLARSRSRVVMGLVFALLIAGTSEPVQRFAFALVLLWGQLVGWWIASPGMTDPFVPAAGATLGAGTGALIALVALWREQTRPPAEEASVSRA